MKNNVKVKQKHLAADDKLSVYFISFYLNRRVRLRPPAVTAKRRKSCTTRWGRGWEKLFYFKANYVIHVLFMESRPTDKIPVNYTVLEHRNVKSTDFYLIGSFRAASAHLPCLLHRFTICEVCVIDGSTKGPLGLTLLPESKWWVSLDSL